LSKRRWAGRISKWPKSSGFSTKKLDFGNFLHSGRATEIRNVLCAFRVNWGRTRWMGRRLLTDASWVNSSLQSRGWWAPTVRGGSWCFGRRRSGVGYEVVQRPAGAAVSANQGAYFSPSWTAFQVDGGRDFNVVVDGVSV
jgi:hypothetical protein